MAGYHGLRSESEFSRSEWTSSEVVREESRLDIDGHPVMQKWEEEYMHVLARTVAERGGSLF